ncbi:phosphatase PAP2 family protein, partial [Candidatus Gottesmanbacteria bacterium]|nr:phosphatase PAP2 family protein [Candidatus Gottesmanbacteria bacterium]
MELLNNAATIFIPLFVTAWLLIKKQRLGGALLVVTFCSVLVNVVLKEIFRINPRSGSGFQLSQYSFPSLSSQLVITFWLYVGLRKKRIIFFVIALILVMFVSFQRILSGQHSVPDVVGGMVVGFVVVLVFLYRETKMMKDTWTRLGIEERFPDPLTPLSQDIFTIVYTLSAKESLEELNLQSTRFIPQYKIFNGYLYHNFDVKRLPKLKLIKLIINFYAHASNAEKEFDRVILDRDAAFFSVLDQVNWKSLSNSKVLELLEQTQGKFTRRMVYETKVAFISEGVTLIAKLMTKLALGKELRMSNGEVESITVDKQLVRLVKDLRYDNTFNRKFNRFIQKYRYRLITYDLISPSWEEEPDKVLNIIRRYGSDPINKVLIKLTGKKTLLKTQNKWVWLARKYYSLKEARYDSRMMYFYWLRKILLQIGKNLVKTNIVGQDEDVFFVSLQNLKDLASKRKGDLQKLRQQIGVKREEWKKQFELNPPSE